MSPAEVHLEEKLRGFLLEDLGSGDITTEALISEGLKAEAVITCNESAKISGASEVASLFSSLGCQVSILRKDGSSIQMGTEVLRIRGPARQILIGERVALNLLGRMSGIATETHKLRDLIHKINPQLRLAATRKTAPGLSAFDKKAVHDGGGDTHRMRLDDAVLIKDNHLKILGSVKRAVTQARAKVSFTKKIEVEVENEAQLREAAESGADIILLDNMNPAKVSHCVRVLEKLGLRKKVLLEASGGITADNLADYARTGVDVLSMGALTKSVRSIDFSLEIL